MGLGCLTSYWEGTDSAQICPIVFAIVLSSMFAQVGLVCQIRSSFEQGDRETVGLNYPSNRSKLCHTGDKGKPGTSITISTALRDRLTWLTWLNPHLER